MNSNNSNRKCKDLQYEIKKIYEENFLEERKKIISMAARLITELKGVLTKENKLFNEYNWILKSFIDNWIWKISELPGPNTKTKFVGQRYWSKKAKEQYKKNCNYKGLRHEHVFPRAKIKERIINCKNNEQIESEFRKIVACVITKEEHNKLNNEKERWERYVGTEVLVVDLLENKELTDEDLRKLNRKENSYDCYID